VPEAFADLDVEIVGDGLYAGDAVVEGALDDAGGDVDGGDGEPAGLTCRQVSDKPIPMLPLPTVEAASVLPNGWHARLRVVFTGAALKLTTLGPSDLLKTKLFALCDRGADLADCMALAPTDDDLAAAEPWLAEQDANPLWPDHVRATVEDLRRRLGRGL
jgi:hypothetical protein